MARGSEAGPQSARSGTLEKFRTKYLDRVSFPLTYDGHPSPDARPEKRDTIEAVHKRYWQNFAQIDRVQCRYSFHSFHNGKSVRGDWDMDARVELRYGQGITIEGKDAEGKPLRLGLSPQGLLQPEGDTRDLSSLVLSLFGAFRARPDVCAIFVDAREDVIRNGTAQTRYDVLIAATTSDMPGRARIKAEYWFSQDSGMLERIDICDSKEESRYGRHASIRFRYTLCNGVYIPTEITQDFPFKGNQFVERYNDVDVLKRPTSR
jgi:hypothetical protein